MITSRIRLFADDVVLYRDVYDHCDRFALEKGLDAIHEWCSTWELELNPEKCTVMNFWEKDISSRRNYTAYGIELSNAEFVKYLRVTITRDLSWGKYIREVCRKANRKLGFVKRILGKCPKKVKEISYWTLVRLT